MFETLVLQSVGAPYAEMGQVQHSTRLQVQVQVPLPYNQIQVQARKLEFKKF